MKLSRQNVVAIVFERCLLWGFAWENFDRILVFWIVGAYGRRSLGRFGRERSSTVLTYFPILCAYLFMFLYCLTLRLSFLCRIAWIVTMPLSSFSSLAALVSLRTHTRTSFT